MADFRMKLMTLAGVATVFAGMAYGQTAAISCPNVAPTANAVFVAAEGTTEQVADTTVTCTATGPGIVNLSVYLSPAVSITSAVLGTGNSAKSESLAGLGVEGAAFTGTPVSGSVSGSSVTFSGITIAGAGSFSVTITNIKINASQIATSSGAPTAVSETIFVGGTNVTPTVLPAVNVAFATNGLASVGTSQLTGNSIPSIPICSGATAYTPSGATTPSGFNVTFSEGFATAFKNQGSSTTNTTLGSEFGNNNTYTGYGFAANGTTNTATSGTRVMIAFNNIPANVTLYVPLTINTLNTPPVTTPPTAPTVLSTMTLTSSATAAFSAVAGSTANGAPGTETSGNNAGNGTYAALTITNGSATAVYEETFNNAGAVENYTVPVYLQAGGSAVTAPSSAITATVSFAPIGATGNVPNFVSGSSTATKNGNAFSACSSTMLFPFVTNQAGFETGIAISNTGNDLLATKNGAPISSVTSQSGTCTLTFFGNATASSNPGAFTTTSNVLPGTTWTGTLTSVTGGTPNTFGGYMIAQCNFLYGHGFAYITYNIGQASGMAMGYLSLEFASPRATGSPTSPESLNN
jgi:hypothetical protein